MGCRLWKYGLLTVRENIAVSYMTALLMVFLLEKNQLIVWDDRTVKNEEVRR